MNIFGGFKEASDVSDANKENKIEVSQEAQNKFEKIMGDGRLPEAKTQLSENDKSNSPFSSSMDKFESLFKAEAVVNTVGVEDDTEKDNSNSETDLEDKGKDDFGKPYRNERGEFLPNSTFSLMGYEYETDENGNICKADGKKIPNEHKDDNGKTYRNPDGGYIPNNTFEIDGHTYETDDSGNICKIDGKEVPESCKDDFGNVYRTPDGKLLPNTEYTINGSTYLTDENGNKISCDAEPEICEEGKRNITEQRESGGEDRKEGDQGGHIIARILGGAEGEENLVPMRGTINQGDYKKMELEIKRALEEGKKVSIHIDLEYDGTSSRPTKIIATYYIDGKRTDIIFDNEEHSTELLETMEGKISDDDFAQLTEEIDDMKNDGCPVSITSVKTEYDEDGNATKVVVGVLDESTGTKSYKVFDAR